MSALTEPDPRPENRIAPDANHDGRNVILRTEAFIFFVAFPVHIRVKAFDQRNTLLTGKLTGTLTTSRLQNRARLFQLRRPLSGMHVTGLLQQLLIIVIGRK